jgi:GT2 family glycosyltransferase/glycosyltransferase involved in cell wall biosynthesis/SAM-dependent methyltransferase
MNVQNNCSSEGEDELDFTGERVIPGKVDADLFNEHFARYLYARQFCVGQKVLDTGCGVGYGTSHLAEVASQVLGIDNEPQAIRYACLHYAHPNAKYIVGDCQRLPLPSQTFDLATSFELIEHLTDAAQYLGEIRRVLKSDGTFVVSTPNRPVYNEHLDDIANPFHVREWDLEEFVSLLEEHFSHVEVLGERHVSAVGIIGSRSIPGMPAVIAARGTLASSDYFICICSRKPRQASEMLFIPASSNVLLERERHIRSLTKELNDREAHLARLQPEFDEKAAWADKLNVELTKTRSQIQEARSQIQEAQSHIQALNSLVAKATRWKRALAGCVTAPLYWLAGSIIVLSEIAGRVLRGLSKSSAPLVAPSDPTRCSIVIVSWEGKDLLSESLPALIKAVKVQGGNHEIIVVDNGSTDGTEEYIRTRFPQVQTIRNPVNDYFAGGNNLGVTQAKNDILILLNNDMVVHEDFLAPLLAGFRSPDVFAVASQVFLADPSKRREETGKARASFNGCDLDWRHETILPSDEEQQYVPVFWAHGGAVAVDRQKFQWLGGFDRLYDPFYVEDADLCYGAWKVGWKCLLAVESKVIHKHRSSTSRFGNRFIAQIVRRNQYLFLWKNFGDFSKLLAHFARAPRTLVRRAGIPGIGIRLELSALLGAIKRLPTVVQEKLHLARSVVRSDREILEITNTPPEATIRSNHIDFALGPFSDQLGSGWHDIEVANGKPHRWMTKQASVFLLAPKEEAELLLQGYVPPLSSYKGAGLNLTVLCCGEQKRFALKEGGFEYHWPVRTIPRGLPVEIELSVNQTLNSSTDQRTLGIAFHSIGLMSERGSRRKIQTQSHRSVSINGALCHQGDNSGQRRILMVCAYVPCLGTHGGGSMMFNLIRHLSKSHRITVLAFYEQQSELDKLPGLAKYCEKVEALYRGQTFEATNLFGLKPPEIVHEFYHRRMERLIKHYLSTQKFDLIQCEYLQTAHFAYVEPAIPAVLTNHEVLSLSRINSYKLVSWTTLAKLKALISAMRMLNYEEQMLQRFSAIVVLTQAEVDFLSRYTVKSHLYCHPMGVDCDFFSPTLRKPDPQSVVFVGNFRHSPNTSGAMWLMERVWPHVLERYPEAQLHLVGNNPTPEMCQWHGKKNVTVTGWVEDVRPYLQRARVVLAPVFEGAGMRTKVLEAWAMAKPVVGTPLAFEGLATEDAGFSFIASDSDTFIRRIQELFQDGNLANAMGSRARDVAISSFSWEAFAAFYSDMYEQILHPTNQERSQAQAPGIQVTSLPGAEKIGRH